jgi:hypothetical protein
MAERLLLAKAWALLLGARLALRTLPLPWLLRLGRARPHRGAGQDALVPADARRDCVRLDGDPRRSGRTIHAPFEAVGLAGAPLRTPALAERLGEPAARAMGDLDVLVKKDDLARLRAILGDRGFREHDRHAPERAQGLASVLLSPRARRA